MLCDEGINSLRKKIPSKGLLLEFQTVIAETGGIDSDSGKVITQKEANTVSVDGNSITIRDLKLEATGV
jgi:hypothetical protein